MAGGLNRVLLLGDLSADPELYVTRAGQPVLTLRLATPESYLDRDGVRRERTGYHHVAVVGRRADALSKTLRRGARIFVEGSLRSTSYETRDGKRRTRTEVVAAEVLLADERDPLPPAFDSPPPARVDDGGRAPQTPREEGLGLPTVGPTFDVPRPAAPPVNEPLPFFR